MKKQGNMYKLSAEQWNPFVGCHFDCAYCRQSFQAQAKRQLHNCYDCYGYKPHEHPNRLTESLPRTGYMQFIFTCASGDVAFCSTPYLERIVQRIRKEANKTFLIQSKNPATFNRVMFPENVILGTTIETNRDALAQAVAKAPPPSQRYADLLAIKHPLKMVTVEPVMDFDLDVMVDWIARISPVMVWLGYDSKRAKLPEPPLEKVRELHWELARRRITVMLKTIPARVGAVQGGQEVEEHPALPEEHIQAEPERGEWTPELAGEWATNAKPHVRSAIGLLAKDGVPKSTAEMNAAGSSSSGGAIVGGLNAWAARRNLPAPLVKDGGRYRFASDELRELFRQGLVAVAPAEAGDGSDTGREP